MIQHARWRREVGNERDDGVAPLARPEGGRNGAGKKRGVRCGEASRQCGKYRTEAQARKRWFIGGSPKCTVGGRKCATTHVALVQHNSGRRGTCAPCCSETANERRGGGQNATSLANGPFLHTWAESGTTRCPRLYACSRLGCVVGRRACRVRPAHIRSLRAPLTHRSYSLPRAAPHASPPNSLVSSCNSPCSSPPPSLSSVYSICSTVHPA